MAQVSGAEAFVRILQRHGVRHVLGLCGDASLPFYDALARLDHGIRHVLMRNERSAARRADASRNQPAATSARTGAWSEGRSSRRGARSIAQLVHRAASSGETRIWSIRRPMLRLNWFMR